MMRGLAAILMFALGIGGQGDRGADARGPALQAPRTWLLVITGVSGEPRFAKSFGDLGTSLVTAARMRFAIPDSMVAYLAEDSTGEAKTVRGRSTKANIEAVLGRWVSVARDGDRIAVIIMGHGSAQSGEPRLNLPGPDMTAGDFARILGPTPATVVFANTASASGEFIKALSGKNRIILTATKSAREQNETFFPAFFVRALTSEVGDVDKDGRVSMLEAFTFARREVEKRFEQGGWLPTEHPMLDDDGDGVGHGDASDKGPDGLRARSLYLEPLGGAVVAADPRAAKLIEERRLLEARIDSLRGHRSAMTEEAYQRVLEPLLVELAEKNRAIRALEVRKP